MLQKLSDEFKLKALLANAGDVVHLAHHVQEPYFSAAERDHHTKGREKAAEQIVRLASALKDTGIPTHATTLANNASDFLTSEELGLHPYLLKHAKVQGGYASSAFRDHSTGFGRLPATKGGKYEVVILTGYNTGMCLKDTATDALDAGFTVILPIDATDNASTNMKSKDETLQMLADRGAILCNASDIVHILQPQTRENMKPGLR